MTMPKRVSLLFFPPPPPLFCNSILLISCFFCNSSILFVFLKTLKYMLPFVSWLYSAFCLIEDGEDHALTCRHLQAIITVMFCLCHYTQRKVQADMRWCIFNVLPYSLKAFFITFCNQP
ncbi:hypothetical protein PFLUV_G00210110 [Perca fluviatilis]|uniref:Uncharacterized protein n=1 Tax=Perca fluviatilis TaxID=8168 RepID=A0A6A5EJW5_PERFL|nr:hypothetical protein PFLUV_G00210110 [Perca fluviatilis]